MNVSALEPEQSAIRSALSWVIVGISVAAVLSNLLVLALFAAHRPLWTGANALVASLAAADLVFGVSLLLSNVHQEVQPYAFGICALVNTLISWSSIASPWSLLALTVDRYVCIRLPLVYARRAGRRAVGAAVAAIWGLSLSFALLGLVPWHAGGLGTRHLCGGALTRTVPYTLVFFALVMLPCGAIAFLYCSILQVARRSNRQHRQLVQTVTGVRPPAAGNRRAPASGNIDCSAWRLTGAPPNTPRQVRRIEQTTQMFLYLMLIFFVLWLPMDVLMTVRTFCAQCQRDARFLVILWVSITLYSCTPLINPWLYTLRNRDFRLALRRLGQCRRRHTGASSGYTTNLLLK